MAPSRFLTWEVDSPIKLLFFLRSSFPSSSTREIKRAIDRGLCRVNGKRERFSTVLLQRGDRVEFEKNWKDVLDEKGSQQSLSTLYQDEFLLAVDKPPFLTCEPRVIKKFFPSECLVHRLDRETSGVLLLAKTPLARTKMEELFATRMVQKCYLAIVEGSVTKARGKIETFLTKKCSFQGQTLWKSASRGVPSSTSWVLLDSAETHSVLLCFPHTGRTHQLRVHLSEMGHPILGDVLYTNASSYPTYVKRLLLHGGRISFSHPLIEKRLTIQAPLPRDFYPYLSHFLQKEFPWNDFSL